MGESTHEWTKKQKISSKQIAGANAVCEDCGQKWTATLAEVPVTIFINDLDEYYKKLNNSLIEAVDPPMVLCVFRPSDREIWDTEITLSCIAPRQESPYNWRINHKHNGPAAASGCQIIPMKYNFETNKTESSSSQQEMVTIKEEIKEEEEDEIIEEIIPDPLADDKDIKPDVNSIAVSGRVSKTDAERTNKSRDKIKAPIGEDEYRKRCAGYLKRAKKSREKIKAQIGEEEYRKRKAEYQRKYRASRVLSSDIKQRELAQNHVRVNRFRKKKADDSSIFLDDADCLHFPKWSWVKADQNLPKCLVMDENTETAF